MCIADEMNTMYLSDFVAQQNDGFQRSYHLVRLVFSSNAKKGDRDFDDIPFLKASWIDILIALK